MISLSDIQTTGPRLPSRIVIYGREGVGKTSLGARLPGSLTVQVAGETGLDTLIDSGQVDEAAHTPPITDWHELVGFVASLDAEHDHRWLILDTLNGVEELCTAMVLRDVFAGKRNGKDGFNSYGRGWTEVGNEWQALLSLLDTIRCKRHMGIICLAHSRVERFINPEGEDFDRYAVAMNKQTWATTHKWADAVMRLDFETLVDTDGDRAKGIGGRRRVLYTENHDAYVAKNRHGLEPEIDLGSTPEAAVTAFVSAFKTAKQSRS